MKSSLHFPSHCPCHFPSHCPSNNSGVGVHKYPKWIFVSKILKSPINGSREHISYSGMLAEANPTVTEQFCILRESKHNQMTMCFKYIHHVFKMVISGYLDITGYSKNDFFTV